MTPIFLSEIESNEATNFLSSIQTLLDGKRNVAFATFEISMIDGIKELGIKIIPTRKHDDNLMNGIFYLEPGKQDAIKLYKIAMSHDGVLNDQSPEEAREIGRLLSYSEESIDEYVQRLYPTYDIPSDDPEDYSDFH